MTEEMQINEIAREICHLYNECETCQICNEKYPTEDSELCYFQCTAKEIIAHDYRKASEVVTEVLANVMFAISKIVSEHIESDNSLTEAEADIIHALAELKKKYTEERNNGKR